MGSLTPPDWSAPGHRAPRRRAAHGFTLIEILVVVAIIAITAGLASLAFDTDDRGSPAELNRWQPLAEDDVLGAHRLPSGISAAPLTFAGQALSANAIVPLRASGRNEPFAFVIIGKETRAVLSADPLNRVTVSASVATSPP